MNAPFKLKAYPTTVSSKGQVVLPKPLREELGWLSGAKLELIREGDSLVIRRAERFFPETRLEDVAGSLKYNGPTISIGEMDRGVLEMARRLNPRPGEDAGD